MSAERVVVESNIHRSLRVADIGVKFVDGIAEVPIEHLPRLRELGHLGVVVPDEAPQDAGPATTPAGDPATHESPAEDAPQDVPDGDGDGETPTAPAGNASGEAWADYAKRLGVTVPDGAGREAIRELVASVLDAAVGSDDDDEDNDDESDTE